MSVNPWDQSPGESDEAYRGFGFFRRMPAGERTLQKAWEQYNPNAEKIGSIFYTWSKKFNWKLRASAWDQHLERMKDKQIEDKIKKEQEVEVDKRRRLLNILYQYTGIYITKLNEHVFMLDPKISPFNPKSLKELSILVNTYNEQSRKEYPAVDAEAVSNAAEQLGQDGQGIREKIQQILLEDPADRGAKPASKLIQ